MTPDPSNSESPLRQILRDASGVPYVPINTLAAAQKENDGYAILEGDDGGMIYVVAPAHAVKINEEALGALLQELDDLAWHGAQPDMRRVYFEKRKPGTVPGGTGGGQASDQVWIHREFREKGLERDILTVLAGQKSRVIQDGSKPGA